MHASLSNDVCMQGNNQCMQIKWLAARYLQEHAHASRSEGPNRQMRDVSFIVPYHTCLRRLRQLATWICDFGFTKVYDELSPQSYNIVHSRDPDKVSSSSRFGEYRTSFEASFGNSIAFVFTHKYHPLFLFHRCKITIRKILTST